jgi:hypothetical protein
MAAVAHVASRVQAPLGKTFLGKQVAAKSVVRARAAAPVRVVAKESWLPGTPSPAHLDGSLVGDFGFDPLSLGTDPEKLKWYQQAELVHCRFAMLGVAGMLAPSVFGNLGIGAMPGAPPITDWFSANTVEYYAPASALLWVQFILFHWVESLRGADIKNPGSVDVDPIFGNKLPAHEVGYNGGIFDPLKLTSPKTKLNEIKNGRLAMVAFLGLIVQHFTTGTDPISNLTAHLADPWNVNVVTNEIARFTALTS